MQRGRLHIPAGWAPRLAPRLALGTVARSDLGFVTFSEEQVESGRITGRTPRVLIEGPAGSGKTHVAAAVAIKYAISGYRVLVLCPRAPLAWWLRQGLEMYGVCVRTIHGHMSDALARTQGRAMVRTGFDDYEFFRAAGESVLRGSFDLVIAEEWQAASTLERAFIEVVAEGGKLLAISDASRDMGGPMSRGEGFESEVTLTRQYRCPEGPPVLLDSLAGANGPSLNSVEASAAWSVSILKEGGDVSWDLLEALQRFRAAGFAPEEIGVVSCLARHESRAVEIVRRFASPRGDVLSSRMSGQRAVADSFAYWLGLERKAVVVLEAGLGLPARAVRLRIASTRATCAVHFLLRQEEWEAWNCAPMVDESEPEDAGWQRDGESSP